MPPKLFPTALLTSATGLLCTYTVLAHNSLSRTPRTTIQTTTTNPPSFTASASVTTHVNPNNHPTLTDTLSTTLPPTTRSDAEILARFTRAYFGGYVFAPERLFLQLFRPGFVHYSKLPTTERIWSPTALSPTTLPHKHAILFGTFQLLDLHIHDEEEEKRSDGKTESFVDFGFGSDGVGVGFAGVHRFAVVRKGDGEVEVVCASLSCNPRADGRFWLEPFGGFHRVYAGLLFREAVAGVVS